MADLVEQMRALRDRKGLVLADALVRQAARDSIGTVESLGSRFMLAGLPQPPEVLRQLVDLRNEASRSGPLPPLKVQPAGPAGPAATAPPTGGATEQEWAGPPSWYREREK